LSCRQSNPANGFMQGMGRGADPSYEFTDRMEAILLVLTVAVSGSCVRLLVRSRSADPTLQRLMQERVTASAALEKECSQFMDAAVSSYDRLQIDGRIR
jgi:hypothetical protein